jgi:hypothetical protein
MSLEYGLIAAFLLLVVVPFFMMRNRHSVPNPGRSEFLAHHQSTEKNVRIDLQHEGSSAGEIVQQRSLIKRGNVNNGIDDLADML